MKHKLAFVRRTIYSRIPLWMRRHDFELFTTLLCFSAGLPLLLTDTVEAQSLEAQLPTMVVRAWALILTVAPIMIFIGVYKSHTVQRFIQGLFWMRLEAAGLRLLFYAAALYGAIVILVTQGKASPAAVIIIIFALTCWSRSASVTIKVEDFLEGIGAK